MMEIDHTLLRRVSAEFIGTFALVVAGCGAIMVNAQTDGLTPVGIALTFGLVVTVMVASMGHISGAHFNPAVTIAFAVTRHFPWCEVVYYVGAQTLGAVMAALTLRLLIGDVASLGTTMPSGSVLQSFALEALLTAMLMFVIIAVATDRQAAGTPAALAIGCMVALGALWGGPISGASMNPARSFGPSVMAGVWENQWVYWLAPMFGAVIGAALYQWIRET